MQVWGDDGARDGGEMSNPKGVQHKMASENMRKTKRQSNEKNQL